MDRYFNGRMTIGNRLVLLRQHRITVKKIRLLSTLVLPIIMIGLKKSLTKRSIQQRLQPLYLTLLLFRREPTIVIAILFLVVVVVVMFKFLIPMIIRQYLTVGR